MHQTNTGCGCGSCASCAALPAEFVRVRYFFGQRLGVMELNDQAIYHAGKMAFHNARLHGYGVICGLRVQKQKPPAGTKSTVVRVSTGAALDPCGRELVVGIDQCIDVAAWFAKNRTRPELAGWTAGTTQTLRVAIRYRECTSDPAPAPRDPCGCDNGGCEYGRVRESFELALFTKDEKICAPAPFAPGTDLLAVTEGCPTPSDESWLCLASFDVTLDGTPVPVDIGEPDNAIPERRTLLSTSALQALLLGLTGSDGAAGLLPAGPRAGALAFTASTTSPTKAGTLEVPISLATSGDPPVDVALVKATFDAGDFAVSRLDTTTGWTPLTPSGGITYDDSTSPPRIKIVFTADLVDGTPFVLAFDPDPAQPTVDKNGAPLGPFTRRFRFVLTGGQLVLAPST
jgi:hypothetical protein